MCSRIETASSVAGFESVKNNAGPVERPTKQNKPFCTGAEWMVAMSKLKLLGCLTLLCTASAYSVAQNAPYTTIDLGTLGGASSYAYRMSDAGQVVGQADTATETHAFLYDSTHGMVDLGTLGGTFSLANGIRGVARPARCSASAPSARLPTSTSAFSASSQASCANACRIETATIHFRSSPRLSTACWTRLRL